MYLFGSIHVANTNKIEFPKYLMDAYNNSHYIACEYDVVAEQNDQEKIMDEMMLLMYQDGTTVKDHLNKDVYEKIVNFLNERKAYTELYDNYKPFFFESLLSLQLASDAGINASDGIDSYFLRKATEDKKEILEVESSEFQLNIFNNFDDELYNIMFNDMLDNYEEEVQGIKDLYQAWKDGNKEKLIELADDDITIENNYTKKQKALIKDYNKKVVDDRNTTMAKKAIEYFNNNQDVFYMVGAFHIISDTGLVNQLQKAGFTVQQVK